MNLAVWLFRLFFLESCLLFFFSCPGCPFYWFLLGYFKDWRSWTWVASSLPFPPGPLGLGGFILTLNPSPKGNLLQSDPSWKINELELVQCTLCWMFEGANCVVVFHFIVCDDFCIFIVCHNYGIFLNSEANARYKEIMQLFHTCVDRKEFWSYWVFLPKNIPYPKVLNDEIIVNELLK